MTNEEFLYLYNELGKIIADPSENPVRRRKALDLRFEMTRGSGSSALGYISSAGQQKDSRTYASIAEAEYNGWMDNRG